MRREIGDFGGFAPEALYRLFRDVYATSDAMSEAFEEKYPAFAAFEEDLAALRALPGAVALAAVRDGTPAGYVTLRPRRAARLRHTADLSIGVAQAARGQGLGGLLLRAALERAHAGGLIEIAYLMVRADNRPAIRLYERAGFERLAQLERDTKVAGGYSDGVLMRRFLDRLR